MQQRTALKRKILVVGSRAADYRVIESATRAWMFETEQCAASTEVEIRLGEKEFDIVFVDENLTEVEYLQVISLGRSHKVPVVVLASEDDRDAAFRKAIRLGAFDILPTPCSAKDVQWMVIRATGQSLKSTPTSRSGSVPPFEVLPRRQ